jgi:hypothetical protein
VFQTLRECAAPTAGLKFNNGLTRYSTAQAVLSEARHFTLPLAFWVGWSLWYNLNVGLLLEGIYGDHYFGVGTGRCDATHA